MPSSSIPAVFMRGGTSKALVFHLHDLPPARPPHECAAWDPIFLSAIGSPDPSGRQLNGMGGGVSSLSKIAVIGPPTHSQADVDYTFGQVAVGEANVGYRGNCGNISSAVGPFAVDEGLVQVKGDEAIVRIHNTNTGKLIVSRFALDNGKAAVAGNFVLAGVAGSGAPIALSFTEPGGAATGKLFPTGRTRDILALAGGRRVDVSLVDAANPVAFVAATALGFEGGEHPDMLSGPGTLALIEEIRVAAAEAMGLVASADEARRTLKNLPLIAYVQSPQDTKSLSGAIIPAQDADIVTRMFSSGLPHRATPLTGAMCLAAAAYVEGTIPHEYATPGSAAREVFRIAHPSGILPVSARVGVKDGTPFVYDTTVYRTARRLMEGRVFVDAGA